MCPIVCIASTHHVVVVGGHGPVYLLWMILMCVRLPCLVVGHRTPLRSLRHRIGLKIKSRGHYSRCEVWLRRHSQEQCSYKSCRKIVSVSQRKKICARGSQGTTAQVCEQTPKSFCQRAWGPERGAPPHTIFTERTPEGLLLWTLPETTACQAKGAENRSCPSAIERETAGRLAGQVCMYRAPR